MAFYKKARKGVKKVLKKRYVRKSGGVKTNRLMKDAMMAYKMLNAEKKVSQGAFNGNQVILVGQVDGNSTGAKQFDITPAPSQGTTSITRNGNSIKLHSSLLQFQVIGQALTISKHVFYVDIFKVNGTPINGFSAPATSSPATLLYDNGVFSGVIDGNSSRFMNNYSDFTLIRSYRCTLPAEQQASEASTKTFTIPLKYNRGKGHHVRFEADGSSVVANGQIVMIMRCDIGNISTTTTSTQPVPVLATQTGISVRCAVKHWFYDN
jgi:hypothetical protein